MKNISVLLISFFFFFIHQNVSCQSNYELLYLEQDFEKIISTAQNKSSIDDYYWLSLALDKQTKTLNAINILEEGNEKFPNNQKLEIQLANLYYETGNYLAAQPYFAKYPDKPELFIRYITVIEFQENYAFAIKLLKDKLVNDSLNIDYLSHLGDNYYQIDSLKLAIQCYDEIFRQNPNDQSTAKKLTRVYLKAKNYMKCIEVCDTILVSDSLNLKFIKIKGMANFNKRNFLDAENSFGFLFNTGDSSRFILKHLGICELQNAKFKKSREHITKAYKLDSSDYETCFFVGKAYLNSQTPEKGLYFYERVDSLLQADPLIISSLYIEKQSIYILLQNYTEALNCYMLAYKYNPKPEYLFFIASMYQNKLQDNKNALNYYNSFLEKLPPKPDEGHMFDEKQITVSLRKIAENNIKTLKEELFFEGELPKK